MTGIDPRRLVIDADVARAAGGGHPKTQTSKNCRDALVVTRSSGHSIIMSPEILIEWGKIMSPFARTWLVEMKSEEKLKIIADTHDQILRDEIKCLAISRKDLAVMQKDLILIETALKADMSVISRDDTVRSLYRREAKNVNKLKYIVWVNPAKEDENPIVWLQEGAQPEPNRMLGYQLPLAK